MERGEGMRLGDFWASDVAVDVVRQWNFLRQKAQRGRAGEVEVTNRVVMLVKRTK